MAALLSDEHNEFGMHSRWLCEDSTGLLKNTKICISRIMHQAQAFIIY